MHGQVDMEKIENILRAYRILGVPLSATFAEIDTARKKMLQRFHPDKHPFGWALDTVPLETRIKMIQESYACIKDNFSEIPSLFCFAAEDTLTSRVNKTIKSQFIYTEIAKYVNEV